MGKKIRNTVLNDCNHVVAMYDDIDGKSRLVQAHELCNDFISSVRIL